MDAIQTQVPGFILALFSCTIHWEIFTIENFLSWNFKIAWVWHAELQIFIHEILKKK